MGCKSMVLEYSWIDNFQTSIQEENGIETLTFSGFCMHSALVVKKVEYITKVDTLHITVFLSLIKKGKSGLFNESVIIPSYVNTIIFGEDEKQIWVRQ
jgi:hypothetical protein